MFPALWQSSYLAECYAISISDACQIISGDKTESEQLIVANGDELSVFDFKVYAHGEAYVAGYAEAKARVIVKEVKVLFTSQPPVADFNFTPTDPQTSEQVVFTSTSWDPEGNPLSYHWRIQDNEGGTLMEANDMEVISFQIPEDRLGYKVTLEVSDGEYTDTRIETFDAITPPPKISSQLESPQTMGSPYKLKFIIDNEARVPINIRITQQEIRDQIEAVLSWNPFPQDYDTLSSYDVNILSPEMSRGITTFVPFNSPFNHKWRWLDSNHWMDLVQQKVFISMGNAIAVNLKDMNPGNPAYILLGQLANFFDSIQVEELADTRLPSVDYLLTDQGTQSKWWVYASDPHELSIPNKVVTVNVSEFKKISLKESYDLMQLAFNFFALSGEFTSDLGRIQNLIDLLSKGSISPLSIIDIVRASITGAILSTSKYNFDVAYDPPDFNYMEIVTPESIEWPAVQEMQDCFGKELIIKHLELLSLYRSHSTSMDRYEGATIDENSEWMVKQLEAAVNYSRQLDEKWAELFPYYYQLASVMPAVDDQMIQDVRDKIAAEGMSQRVKDILLRETELSEEDLDIIEEMYLTIDADWFRDKNLSTYLAFNVWKDRNQISNAGLSDLINLKVELGESIIEPTSDELDLLNALKNEILAAIADPNYAGNLMDDIRIFRDTYEAVLKRTNNLSAVEPFIALRWQSLGGLTIESVVNDLGTDSIADAGPDQNAATGSDCIAPVTLDGSASLDAQTFTWYWEGGSATGVAPTIQLPIGVHTITLIINEGKLNFDTDTLIVTVNDPIAPQISLSVTPDILWPPNHKMVPITVNVATSDNCGMDTIVSLQSITMKEGEEMCTFEPSNGVTLGECLANDDIFIDGNGIIHLKAERLGTGTGRTYTITYTATDTSGNSSNDSTTVKVPHNSK